MRKEIKDHESSKMHSSNRFSVCKGVKLKRFKKPPLLQRKKALKDHLTKVFCLKTLKTEEFKLERKWRCIKNVFITEKQNFFLFIFQELIAYLLVVFLQFFYRLD